MKRNKLTPGIVLVCIGLLLLLVKLNVLHFHWMNILHLWPVFLIIGGINLLLSYYHETWARVLKALVWVGGLCLIFFADFGNRYTFFPHFTIHTRGDNDFDIDDDDDDTTGTHGVVKVDGNSYYHTPYNDSIRTAKLNLEGGGTTYRLADTTSELFAADVKEYSGRYSLTTNTHDSLAVMDFHMRSHHGRFEWDGNNRGNKAVLKLNNKPEWQLSLKAGATDLDFDLSKFKIRTFNLNGGAASFKVKLGQPVASNTEVIVNSGMSDVTVDVPRNAPCVIESKTGLSDNNFDGFTKTGGHYETPGLDFSKPHINIKIKGGLSDFKVRRY